MFRPRRQPARNSSEQPEPRRRLTYANVAATLALVLAIGGGSAYAAKQYLVSSTKQIAPNVLKKLHGASGTNGTNGANGATGATGATGTAGTNGATSVVEEFASAAILANSNGSVTVNCPAGTKATGGGGFDIGDSTADLYQDGPLPASVVEGTVPTGWEVSYKTGANPITAYADAICASP
jgi:hypothetical protein